MILNPCILICCMQCPGSTWLLSLYVYTRISMMETALGQWCKITNTSGLYHKHIRIVNDAVSIISKWRSKIGHHLQSYLMTLAKAEAKAKTKTKHFNNAGINYECHLRLWKYFLVQATSPACLFPALDAAKFLVKNFQFFPSSHLAVLSLRSAK